MARPRVVLLLLALYAVPRASSRAPSSPSSRDAPAAPLAAVRAPSSACAALASAACTSAPAGAAVAFFPTGLAPPSFGVALCAQHGPAAALACSAAPASLFFLSAGGENTSALPALVSSAYSAVNASAASASASVVSADGSALLVRDTFALAGAAAASAFAAADAGAAALSLVRVSRVVSVASASGAVSGFCSRLALQVLPATALQDWLWFAPGLLYGDGEFTPPWAIGGAPNRSAVDAVVFREDRAAAPMAALIARAPGSRGGVGVAAILRPSQVAEGAPPPDTVFQDTLLGAGLIDARMAFAGLGFERGAESAALVATYPGSEYPHTYQSQAPSAGLWRYHPLSLGAPPSAFSVLLALGALAAPAPPAPAPLLTGISWLWRGAHAYYRPLLRADIDLLDAHEALVASLADTFLDASPIPGVPTGFDKLTGVAYSSIIELGFVGPQLRMAVALLQDGLARPNATRVATAAAMLDAWVAATGPGYTHAVWDMGVTAAAPTSQWIDDGVSAGGAPLVYLRRVVVSHTHALEAAALAAAACAANATSPPVDLCARAPVWRSWALSLADTLLALQAPNGSFARQYALPRAAGALPTPSQPSTTSTALVLRYLVAAAAASGNASMLAAARAAGAFAASAYASRGLFAGAAIDNPDVVDKESALFALDGFLALADAEAGGGGGSAAAHWRAAAAAAGLVAATWQRLTAVPNPRDHPAMDWSPNDTAAGLGLIALGHSGSDSFDSMFIWPRLRLCALTGDAMHAAAARLALANSKQALDLDGRKGYAMRGFMSELVAFSVGWDIFSGHNDGRGVGDFHFVPWTSANGAYGAAALCLAGADALASLPAQCQLGLRVPAC